MQQSLTQHIRKKYNTLYARTAKAIQSGKFITYTKAKRKALQERLHRYERRLKNWGIAVASVAALFGAPIAAKGQITFTPQLGMNNPFGSLNPFEEIIVGSPVAPTFVDIDGDGDLDAFIGEYYYDSIIRYYQNIGSSSSPVFVEQTGANNPFNGSYIGYYSAPTFVDIDGDGDLDAFIGEFEGNINYFQNTGSSSSPAFVEQTGINNPLNGLSVDENSKPVFVDIDGDGDFDAAVGNRDGLIYYFQNTGSSSNPAFVAQTGTNNPFDGINVGSYSTPTFIDIDGDGDLDTFIGEQYGSIFYFQNTGSSNSPAFVAQTGTNNPLDGINVIEYSAPTFADIDSDGDFDAFIGDYDGNINYYKNIGSSSNPVFISINRIDIGENSTPTFVDIDGDGDFDAFSGERFNIINYYKNEGSNTSPVFVIQTGASNPLDGVNVGYRNVPTFADIDGDGDFDTFVGGSAGTLFYFQNTGSSNNPAFVAQTGVNNPFDGIDVGAASAPTFVDIDGDGDLDTFIGEQYGSIFYFQNTGSSNSPAFVAQTGENNPLDGITVRFRSKPTFVDIDDDGDFDAFIGTGSGTISYFQNTGSSGSPAFAEQTGTNNPLDGTEVSYNSTPTFVDIDGDGDFDAFIGEGYGIINYFRNDSPIIPVEPTTFVEQTGIDFPVGNPFVDVNVGGYSAPTFADIDGDGDFDAFVGEKYGSIFYFQNTGTSSSPAFVEQTGTNNPLDGINVGEESKPTFVDIDDDGDSDVFIGEYDGTILYFQNTGTSGSPAFVAQTGSNNPFDGIDVGFSSTPSFVDIDGDGDFDAFIGEYYGTILYFQNTGTSSSPAFVEQTGSSNPFDGVEKYRTTPTFVDIDGDGDFDAFIGEEDGIVNYFQNVGSSGSPAFEEQTGINNPLDGIEVDDNSAPAFVDIDGDGDFDAFVGEEDGSILYFQNLGTSSSPTRFIDLNLLYSAPAFVDIDGDGDFDAFVGAENGNIFYFQNTGTSSNPGFVAQIGGNNPLNSVDVTRFSTPTFVDIDGDGDFDAFIGEEYGTILYFENTGSNISPAFEEQVGTNNPLNSIDVGLFSTPTFVDIDGDGDFDAFIGEDLGTIKYYQNTGSASSPAFEEQIGGDNPLSNVALSRFSSPTFVDIDGDGDFDALIGEDEGIISYFRNIGSISSPTFVAQTGKRNPFNGIDVGEESKPAFVDIDGDGDFDAFIGEEDGDINYFENTSPLSCTAIAGELGNSEDIATIELCEGTDTGVLFEQTGASANDEYAFLLVNENGDIVANNSNGDFDLAALSVGTYTVYGLSYASNNSPTALADYLADKTSISAIETDDADTNFCLELSNTAITEETNLITIKPLPVISQQPNDQAICEGETATFEVTASGDDLSYQWQLDGADLNDETNTSLNADQTGDYNVLITQNGCTVSSDTVSLTLDPSCDIPDISTLEVSYCGKELSADFEPVPGAVGYRAEITVLGRNGEVITRNIPTPPFDLKISVPERLLGTTIQVRLAAIFIDAETQERVVGTFSESRNIVIMNCGTRNSDDLESRGSITTALSHALLSPNPASEILNLSYASLSSSQVEIMLVDGTGRMVWQTKQTSSEGNNQLEIPVADLPAGMYQLRLVIAEEVAVLPFVKQ